MKSDHDKSNLNDMMNMPDAENDLFDLFENPFDAINDGTEPEDGPITDEQKGHELGLSMPVSSTEKGIMKPTPVKAEVVENGPPVAIKTTGPSAPQIWMPWLPSSLSAQTLFNLALNVDALDPVRQMLGFYYEQRLRYECTLLIPNPIPIYYRRGIWKALMIRRSNPDFFMCNAIDAVLTYCFNYLYPEDNDVFSWE